MNRTLWNNDLAELWQHGDIAQRATRTRFSAYLGQDDDWAQQADATVRKRLTRQRFEVRSLLRGELPEPECFEDDRIRGCPLAPAYDALAEPWSHISGEAWFELGALWSEREYYEHALASFFNAWDSVNDSESLAAIDLHVASILAAWGDADLAVPLFGRVVARSTFANPELATAAKLHALMAVPPVVPRDLDAYRTTLRHHLRVLSESDALAATLNATTLGHRVGKTFFHLAHQCENEVREFEWLAAAFRRIAPDLALRPPIAKRQNLEPTVGFVSAHLSDHSIGKMLAELLAHLATRLPAVVVFHVGRAQEHDDAVRAFLSRNVQSVVLAPSIDSARAAILEANLDILVYPDIGMEPWSYLLAFSRLARVQCVWWGHPVTTGLPTVDYYLSLDTEVDDAHQHYAEQLVRIDLVNTAPFVQVLDLKARLGDTLKPRAELVSDNDPGGALYLVLGRLFKLHPSFDDVLFRILERDPTGLVLLVAEPQARVTHALYRRFENRSTLDRLRFVDYWNYVHALATATVVIDTYPYGGCLTALDAMSNSKPFVTLPGPFERGRFAMSIYSQMNLTDYVATSVDHFLDLALRLGTDPAANAHAVRRISAAYPRAHQPASLADEWTALFTRMHHTAF